MPNYLQIFQSLIRVFALYVYVRVSMTPVTWKRGSGPCRLVMVGMQYQASMPMTIKLSQTYFKKVVNMDGQSI